MKKLGFLCILLAFPSHAAFDCVVNVDRVLVYKDGAINIRHDGRNDFTHICNLKGNWKGVDTVTCAMWTSMLQSIQNNKKMAIFHYNDSGSCSSLPTYDSAPAPIFIGSID